MPVEKYFKGKGKEVMKKMKKTYGKKKGLSVFYATANKKKETAKKSIADTYDTDEDEM